MPNPGHFDWHGTDCTLLALPRPSSCPSLGCHVQLRQGSWDSGSVLIFTDAQRKAVTYGPLAPGDIGQVVDDVPTGEAPFLVQELTSGRLWWYPEAVLQPIPANAAPHDVQHPASPGEGSYVTLVADYKSFSDAGRGPLSLMRTEDAYGVVLMESGNRFRVRCCHGNRGDWWYDHGAVRPIHMKYVPESLRAAVRPGWGDYVALSHDHGSFGTAADGPMEPGNLGVVVAVHDVPDSKGGLTSARYTVRACHNGQAYRYQEGALHLVVQQLLHSPKIPPTTAKGRARRLSCTISITEPVSGDSVAVGQVLSRGEVQQVQQIVPGHKYWIAVKIACKTGDMMLANLKPCAFDLYAPTGMPGQYVHLPPVSCKQMQQRQQQEGLWQQQGPEMVSLAFCNGSAGGAGSNVWYNAIDDEAVCVFEWESAETPMPLQAGRVAAVDFVWAACFKDVPGQAKRQHRVLLQTIPSSSAQSTAAASLAAGAAAAAQPNSNAAGIQQPASAGQITEALQPSAAAAAAEFEWLDDIYGTSVPARANRRKRSGSSHSDEDDGDRCDSEDSSSDAGTEASSSDSDADSETSEDGTAIAAAAAAVAAVLSSRGNPGSRRDRDGSAGAAAAAGNNVATARQDGSSNGNATGPSGNSSSSSGADSGAAAPPTPPASMSPEVPEAVAADSAAAGNGFAASRRNRSEGTAAAEQMDAGRMTAGQAAVDRPESQSSVGSAEAAGQRHSRPPSMTAIPAHGAASTQATPSSSRLSLRPSSSSGSLVSRSSSITGRASSSSPAASSSSAAAAAAAGTCSRRTNSSAAAPSGNLPNIQEIMRQFEVQAESNQPFWQPGTELAADLAAKAMAAAEEWQQEWCRPRE